MLTHHHHFSHEIITVKMSIVFIIILTTIITLANSKTIEKHEEDDTVVIENSDLTSKNEDDVLDLITELLLTEDDDEEEEPQIASKDLDGNQRLILPHFNPGQIFDPITQKINKWASILTHPNAAFPIPRPLDLWSKIQDAGSHFLGGVNGAIFGLGQIGGHDYPFPYRNAGKGRGLDVKDPDYLRKILKEYEEKVKDGVIIPNKPTEGYKGAYIFPFLLNPKEVKEFVKNVTEIIEN